MYIYLDIVGKLLIIEFFYIIALLDIISEYETLSTI